MKKVNTKIVLNHLRDLLYVMKQEVLFSLIVVVFAILTFLIPGFFTRGAIWDNYKFILMAGLPVIGFGYILLKGNKFSLPITYVEISWFIFLSVGFLSFLWAINGSLVWYQAFNWLGLVLWMLLFRLISLKQNVRRHLPLIFLTLFLGISLHVLLALFTGRLSNLANWNTFFGYNSNANFTSAYLVGLYPFLLFYNFKTQFFKVIKVITTGFVAYVLYLASARGSIVALLIVLLYYIWIAYPPKYFWRLLGGGAFLLGLLFFFYNTELLLSIPVFQEIEMIKEFSKKAELTRYYMLQSSYWLFLENPLLGIGLNNWHLEAYKYNLSNLDIFNVPDDFYQMRNHNFFGKQLSEIGLLGFLSFLYPFSLVLWKGIRRVKTLSTFHRAGVASILVYIITSFFYEIVNSSEYHFSELQFVVFCIFGYLSKNDKCILMPSKWIKVIFLICSLFCFSWFVYAKYTSEKYSFSKQFFTTRPFEAIRQIEAVYHPIFNTSYKYNTSLSFELAKLYQKQKAYTKADKYFRLSIQERPYSRQILYEFAQFLKNRSKLAEAETYALRAYAMQNNNWKINLLLAEITLAQKKYERATSYLEKLQGVESIHDKRKINLLLAEIAFYKKNYEAVKDYLKFFDDEGFTFDKMKGYLLLSELAFLEKDIEKARYYVESVSRGKKYEPLSLKMAVLYDSKSKRAEELYKIALEKEPNNKDVLLNYATFLYKREQFEESKLYALKIYEKADNDFDANLLLGRIAFKEGDYELAKYYLEKLYKLPYHQYQRPANLLLAKIAMANRDTNKAKQYLKDYDKIKFFYHKIPASLLLTEIAIQEKDYRKAKGYLEIFEDTKNYGPVGDYTEKYLELYDLIEKNIF